MIQPSTMEATNKETTHIELLKRIIEKAVAWGNSQEWTHQDFEQLSECIWQKTQTKLSATTLKRLWGKVTYQSQPATNTLNALARFADYEHWRDFVGSQSHVSHTVKSPPPKSTTVSRKLALLLIPILVLIVLGFNRWVNRPIEIDAASVSFSSEPVTRGVPNTVIFHYDVSELPYDQVEIQQSWDSRLRQTVDKESQVFTTTYYYPGYFRAKLLVENQIVKEHDVYVTSNGWLALVTDEPIPHYLDGKIKQNGTLTVSPERLQQLGFLSEESVPSLAYYNVQDFGELSSGNFTLETAIKSEYNQGEAVCQEGRISIICSNGRIAIPWVVPGCVGTINLAASEVYLDGETSDLSAFGCNVSQWQHIRLQVEQQQLSVYRNDSLVFQTNFQQDAGKVAGLRYQFRGTGSVDYIRLRDENQAVIFQDDFTN